MKTFAKVTSVIAVAFVILGIVLMVFSVATSPMKPDDMMDDVLDTLNNQRYLNFKLNVDKNGLYIGPALDEPEKYVVEYDADDIEKIYIAGAVNNVSFIESDDADTIRVTYYNRYQNEFECDVDDEKLTISSEAYYSKKGFDSKFLINLERCDIIIEYPAGYKFTNVKLDTVNCNIDVKSMLMRSFKLDGVNCKLSAENIISDKITLDGVNCNMNIEYADFQELEMDGVNTRIEIESAEGTIDEFTVNSNSVNGKVIINGENIKSQSGGERVISADVLNGTIKINTK